MNRISRPRAMMTDAPSDAEDDGEPVEVPFRDAGGAKAELMPPPNMSDSPPPRPLWSRMSNVSRRLVMPRRICRMT